MAKDNGVTEVFATQLGTMNDELEKTTKKFNDSISEDIQKAIQQHVRSLSSGDILRDAVNTGDVFPDFVLPDQNGDMVSSAELRTKGPLVVIFFRGGWCPHCETTLKMVRKYYPHFKARGATVVAISPQTIQRTAVTIKEAGLTFTVLSDTNSEYTQLLNLAYVVDDNDMNMVFDRFGLCPKEINGTDKFILPVPATYVVQSDSRVTYSFLDSDYQKRADPVEVLNALPSLQVKQGQQTLRDKLETDFQKIRRDLPVGRYGELFNAVRTLKESGIEKKALGVGARAPAFRASDQNGHLVDSTKLTRGGPLVIIFIHGHKSQFCITQLSEMQSYLQQFEAKGAKLVAICPSGLNDLSKVVAKSAATFQVASDLPVDQVANQFGLLHQFPGDFVLGDSGIVQLPMAAVFVVEQSGQIVYSHVNVDPTKRPEPKEVLEAVPFRRYLPKSPLKRGPFSVLLGKRLPRSEKYTAA